LADGGGDIMKLNIRQEIALWVCGIAYVLSIMSTLDADLQSMPNYHAINVLFGRTGMYGALAALLTMSLRDRKGK